MKEFIDKLINELEKLGEHCLYMNNWQGQTAICDAIEIVNELAEEYINCSTDTSTKSTDYSTKVSEMPTGWIIDGKGIHKQTNADRIRSMTDEELAEFFANKSPCDYYCNYKKKCCSEISCKQGILEWLQSESE